MTLREDGRERVLVVKRVMVEGDKQRLAVGFELVNYLLNTQAALHKLRQQRLLAVAGNQGRAGDKVQCGADQLLAALLRGE